jgi:predicted Zn-dependent protease
MKDSFSWRKIRVSIRHWPLHLLTLAVLVAVLIGVGDLSLKFLEHHSHERGQKGQVPHPDSAFPLQDPTKDFNRPSPLKSNLPGKENQPLNPETGTPDLKHDQYSSSDFKSAVNPSLEEKKIDPYQTALTEIGNHQLLLATETLQSILRTQPEDEHARAVLGILYIDRGSTEKATTLVTEGLNINPNSIPLNLIYAHLMLLKNEPQEALRILKTIQNTADNMPEYIELLAFTQSALGNYQEAIEGYHFLLSEDPQNPRLLINLAISLEKAKQNENALLIYKQVNSNKNLSPELRAYVTQHLDTLEH